MLSLWAIYHSNRLSEQIRMRVSLTLVDACLVRYPSFDFTASYRHATTASYIPFKPSQWADSDEGLPDPVERLPGELEFFYIYWQLQACHHHEPYTIRFVSASGFKWYASQLDPTAGGEDTFHSVCYRTLSLTRILTTEGPRHATALGNIPFNSSQWADSDDGLPNPGGCLPGKLPLIYIYWQLQTCHCREPYTIRFVSESGLKWCASWLDPTTGCGDTFHFVCAQILSLTRMLTTEGYRHATSSSHKPFKSSQWADSNEGLPNTGGRLPGELPFF